MDEFTIAGCGRFGDQCIIEGAVVTIRDIGKGRYYAIVAVRDGKTYQREDGASVVFKRL